MDPYGERGAPHDPPRGMDARDRSRLLALVESVEADPAAVADVGSCQRASDVVEGIARAALRERPEGVEDVDGFELESARLTGDRLVLRGLMWTFDRCIGSCRAVFELDGTRSRILDYEVAWGSAWAAGRRPEARRRRAFYRRPNRWRCIARPSGFTVNPPG